MPISHSVTQYTTSFGRPGKKTPLIEMPHWPRNILLGQDHGVGWISSQCINLHARLGTKFVHHGFAMPWARKAQSQFARRDAISPGKCQIESRIFQNIPIVVQTHLQRRRSSPVSTGVNKKSARHVAYHCRRRSNCQEPVWTSIVALVTVWPKHRAANDSQNNYRYRSRTRRCGGHFTCPSQPRRH